MTNKTYNSIINRTKKSRNELLEEIGREYSKMIAKRKATRKTRKDCKCDCGHTKEQHYIGEGCCNRCGCTWFYPCIARVKKNIAKKKRGIK